jgi:hypothetical protein
MEERLQAIEQRNRLVSLNKKWETSLTRRFSIAVITYAVAAVIFTCVIPQEKWYLAALVPVAGYLLSTLGLPRVRQVWEKFQKEGE